MNKEASLQSQTKPDTRIGVIICDCGGEVSTRLDTEALRQHAAALPQVIFAAHETYPCSKDGQARLRQAIAARGLNRVLIAGCAPRLVEKLFQQAAASSSAHVQVADIREQCAYVHADDPAAMQKASDLIEMSVARLAWTDPPSLHTGRVVKSVMVIGSGLSGLTVAATLADSGIPVTLVEQAGALGGPLDQLQDRARELSAIRIQAVSSHPRIHILLNAHVTEVSGHAGDYEIRVAHNGQISTFAVGGVVVATGARPQELSGGRWYDRAHVKTQAEFEQELNQAVQPGRGLAPRDIVMVLCAEQASGHCSRICCTTAIRQATRVKQYSPNANVTILFRELYLGGSGDLHEGDFHQACELGVTFFRYRQGHPPVIGDKAVDIHNTLTNEPVRVPFDRVVLAMPIVPQDRAQQLAALLGLPQDEHGFIAEPRVRLRPGRYADDGIYVVGGAHQPVDTAEVLFQAFMVNSRVLHFLSQDEIAVKAPVAEINATLCTGCGNCVQVCPAKAIRLASRKREGVLSLSEVDGLRCIGCGNCTVACPVKAITLPGWGDPEILAQISAAWRAPDKSAPRVLALACEWSAYAAADMAGARQLAYPADARIIRMNCSARFDPYHILWAFVNGADGVFLGACPPGECHYGTGNLYAKERVEALKKQLAERGIDPHRLRLEFLPGDDGNKFAQTMTDFVTELKNSETTFRKQSGG